MIQTKVVSSLTNRKGADALILPFFEEQILAFSGKGLAPLFEQPLKAGDFKGKSEEVLCHYPTKGEEKRLILVGLGKEKELTKEGIRISFAKAIQSIKAKIKNVNVQVPETDVLEEKEIATAVIEGVLLAAYVFDGNKSEKEKTISQATFIGANAEVLRRCQIICKNVWYARELIIRNADEVTPQFLGEQAKEIAKHFSTMKATVWGRKEIEKQKLHLLAAVGQGSETEPALITLEYKGAPESKSITALVGKGVTFDTGGLNLKPTGSIETMRDDMSGAAAILATLSAVAALKLPINLVGVIAATENAIGPKSYKPGDVFSSHSGLKVEITNTDAEGRLILADALSYVQKHYKPERIIDIATLTGGAIIALGEEVSALMTNDDQLAEQLIRAGESTYERLWRLPLYKEYNDLLKSKIADFKNSGVRKASPIQGGIFLLKFIKECKWAHIDIAGTAFPDQQKSYHSIQATGVGVRLLTAFLESLVYS